jgi:hypothetical protein
MPAPILIRSAFFEGEDPGWTLAQVVNKLGVALVETDVQTITLNVYDTEDNSIVFGPTTILPGGVVLNAWTYAGTIWTEDDIGCNFADYKTNAVIFASTEAQGGKQYRAEYALTLTASKGGQDIMIVHLMDCRPMIGF